MEDAGAVQGAAPQHDALVMLSDWRERGARRVDPIRFDFLEALARRAAACEGAARRLLDDKLAQAMSRHRETCAQAGCVLDGEPVEAPPRRAKPTPTVPGALAQLLAHLDSSRRGMTAGESHVASAAPAAPGSGAAKKAAGQSGLGTATVSAQRPGEAQEALAYFRRTWTRLDARRRLAQSQANLPVNAGPLNSQQLVHRALTLMQGAAPGYLHQLMAYVDALSALEPFQPAAAAPAPMEPARGDARAGGAARKTGRGKRG